MYPNRNIHGFHYYNNQYAAHQQQYHLQNTTTQLQLPQQQQQIQQFNHRGQRSRNYNYQENERGSSNTYMLHEGEYRYIRSQIMVEGNSDMQEHDRSFSFQQRLSFINIPKSIYVPYYQENHSITIEVKLNTNMPALIYYVKCDDYILAEALNLLFSNYRDTLYKIRLNLVNRIRTKEEFEKALQKQNCEIFTQLYQLMYEMRMTIRGQMRQYFFKQRRDVLRRYGWWFTTPIKKYLNVITDQQNALLSLLSAAYWQTFEFFPFDEKVYRRRLIKELKILQQRQDYENSPYLVYKNLARTINNHFIQAHFAVEEMRKGQILEQNLVTNKMIYRYLDLLQKIRWPMHFIKSQQATHLQLVSQQPQQPETKIQTVYPVADQILNNEQKTERKRYESKQSFIEGSSLFENDDKKLILAHQRSQAVTRKPFASFQDQNMNQSQLISITQNAEDDKQYRPISSFQTQSSTGPGQLTRQFGNQLSNVRSPDFSQTFSQRQIPDQEMIDLSQNQPKITNINNPNRNYSSIPPHHQDQQRILQGISLKHGLQNQPKCISAFDIFTDDKEAMLQNGKHQVHFLMAFDYLEDETRLSIEQVRLKMEMMGIKCSQFQHDSMLFFNTYDFLNYISADKII